MGNGKALVCSTLGSNRCFQCIGVELYSVQRVGHILESREHCAAVLRCRLIIGSFSSALPVKQCAPLENGLSYIAGQGPKTCTRSEQLTDCKGAASQTGAQRNVRQPISYSYADICTGRV